MPKPMVPGLSPAVESLGLGGMLDQQAKDETEEERKKRMRQMQEQSFGGSPATMALFGGSGERGY